MNYLKTRGMYLSVEWLQIDCKLLQKKIYVSVREWQCERTESILFQCVPNTYDILIQDRTLYASIMVIIWKTCYFNNKYGTKKTPESSKAYFQSGPLKAYGK